VGRLLGIPIRLHATFLLLLVWVAMVSARGGDGFLRGLVFLLLLIASVTVHELAHALVARRHGVATEEIVLLPIGGIARQRGEVGPRAQLAIALAGPFANLTLAVALAVAVLLRGQGLATDAAGVLGDLLLGNLALFGFNLLPVPPLDGGRALRAAIALLAPAADAGRVAARIGQAFAALLALGGVLLPGGLGLPLLLLAALLFFGAGQEAMGAARQQALAGRTAADAMMARFERLAPQEPLEQAALLLLRTPQADFPVIDAWGRAVGTLDRGGLLAALGRHGGAASVLEAMDRRVLAVAPSAPLAELHAALRGGMPSPVVVVEGGEVRGIVTLESIERMVGLLAAMARQEER
jgi:stage IV sporulation protein FB